MPPVGVAWLAAASGGPCAAEQRHSGVHEQNKPGVWGQRLRGRAGVCVEKRQVAGAGIGLGRDRIGVEEHIKSKTDMLREEKGEGSLKRGKHAAWLSWVAGQAVAPPDTADGWAG